MGCMFHNCIKLEYIDATKFNTAKVTDIHSMFNGCSSLKGVDFSENFIINEGVEIKWIFSRSFK